MENFKKWCGKVCGKLKKVAVEKCVGKCVDNFSVLGNLKVKRDNFHDIFTLSTA